MSYDLFDFIFNAIFIIVPILMLCIIAFSLLMKFSPKFIAKMNRLNIKAVKYTVEDSQKDIADIISTAANTAIDTKNMIINEKGDDIKRMAKFESDIKKDRIESIAKAVRDGLSENDTIYCKHCGEKIDEDSLFCKKCGKEQ